MYKDTREELKRLEEALFSEEAEKLENAENLDDFLEGLLDEPTDSLAQTGAIPYRNFANGYTEAELEFPEEYGSQREEEPELSRETVNAQLYIATALLMGIAAVLVYWVVRFL